MPIKEFRADLVPKIKSMDLHAKRKILLQTLTGSLVTSFAGRGMEFEGYRQYTQQDDATLIDWRASLRSQKLLMRQYNIERNFNVFFLIDVSNSMLFASTEKLKCEYTAELASTLGYTVLEMGAGLGFGIFTDKLVFAETPKFGRKQFYALTRELTNVNNYGGNFSLENALKYSLSILKQKALVFIFSDFIGLKGNWFKYLEILSQSSEVVGFMIRDPRDRALPRNTGQYLLEDPFSGERLYVDVNDYATKYAELVQQDEKLIKKKFELTKSDFMLLTTDMDFNEKLLAFFKRRTVRWK